MTERTRPLSPRTFAVLLFVVVLAGITRSWLATRRDGMQIDEAWHAVAGISYARTGDFRLNPEHPPLAKLWVGALMPERSFTLPPFRALLDKEGERAFIDDAFYIRNDPRVLQHHVRMAMLTFHGLCLLALGWSLRRIFGGALALLTIALLVVDPTVAAHMPVILTDLPLTLLSALAVTLALSAFASWHWRDLGLCALALGLTLASKHSAIPVGLFVLTFGVVAALRPQSTSARVRLSHLGAVLAVASGACLVLWAFYGFRFAESPLPHAAATFNRPIETKIADLHSAGLRGVLQLALDFKLLPRAYLWGLADILRAGVEGRQDLMYVFGKLVFGNTPWYFFPAVLLVKLPLGVIALASCGLVLLVRRALPASYRAPSLVLLAWAAFYMVFIVRGNSGYAGVRHAAPVLPVIALCAALALQFAVTRGARAPQIMAGVAVLGLGVSTLPIMRPWEYYNELVGGPDGAWRYFADDGLDNGQRVKDIAAYYDAHLRGTDERVYDFYDLFDSEKQAYDLHFREITDDPLDSDVISGTLFVNTRWLGERPLYDYAALRAAQPVARFGNALVLRGRFQIAWLRADRRMRLAHELLATEGGDTARAEELMQEVTEIYPADYQAAFELGNLRVEKGAHAQAIRAYTQSRAHAPAGDSIVAVLSQQIDQLASDSGPVRPLRNPWLE